MSALHLVTRSVPVPVEAGGSPVVVEFDGTVFDDAVTVIVTMDGRHDMTAEKYGGIGSVSVQLELQDSLDARTWFSVAYTLQRPNLRADPLATSVPAQSHLRVSSPVGRFLRLVLTPTAIDTTQRPALRDATVTVAARVLAGGSLTAP